MEIIAVNGAAPLGRIKMSEERLVYYGRIKKIDKGSEGYSVGIDLFDLGNTTFYIWMKDEPKGIYLKYYSKWGEGKPSHRIEINNA